MADYPALPEGFEYYHEEPKADLPAIPEGFEAAAPENAAKEPQSNWYDVSIPTAKDTASFLRGARQALPFGQDIGAAFHALQRGQSFDEAKRAEIARDNELAQASPNAFTRGKVISGIGTPLIPGLGDATKEDWAAGMRGAREAIPFGQDVGAFLHHPVESLTGGFSKAKEQEVARDEALRAAHPKAYTAGEVAGAIGTALTPGLGEVVEAPNLLGTAARLATSGAGAGVLHGLGQGVTAEDRLKNAAAEGAVGALAPIVTDPALRLGKAIARPIAGLASNVTPKSISEPLKRFADPATIWAEKKAAAQKNFDNAFKDDVYVQPHVIENFRRKMENDLYNRGYDKDLPGHAPITKAMRRLEDATTNNQRLSLRDLQNINRLASNATTDPNKSIRQLGGHFNRQWNNLLDSLGAHNTVTVNNKPATEAVKQLQQARKDWHVYSKADQVREAVKNAEMETQASGTGANIDNKLRQAAVKLQKKKFGFKPHEREALERVYSGTPLHKITRPLSGLAPTGRLSTSLALLNPVTWATAPVGMAAHAYNNAATRAAMDDVLKTIEKGKLSRAGSSPEKRAARLAVPAVLPPANFTGSVDYDDRGGYASGGKIQKRDYPAKRLTLAAKRALREIQNDSKQLMEVPDEHMAAALHRVKE